MGYKSRPSASSGAFWAEPSANLQPAGGAGAFWPDFIKDPVKNHKSADGAGAFWAEPGPIKVRGTSEVPPPPAHTVPVRGHHRDRGHAAAAAAFVHHPQVPPGNNGLQAAGQSQVPRGPWGAELEAWSTNTTKSWYHPRHYKKRFCAWYPDSSKCRRGEGCAFAHSRDEVRAPLLTEQEEEQEPASMTEEFFMFKFKTRWCPIGIQHNWQNCVYAHNYQDARRDVSIGYGSAACPHWNRHETGAEYWQRCPMGVQCPYAHGAKETLYHPEVFRTVVCRDRCDKSACPRQRFCAFFHGKQQVRRPIPVGVDYRKPLPAERIDSSWLDDFLTQPFPPGENAMGNNAQMEMAMAARAPNPMDVAIAEQRFWQQYAATSMPPAPPPWLMGAALENDPYKNLEAAALTVGSPRTQSTASSDRGNHEERVPTDEDLLGLWQQHWAHRALQNPHYQNVFARGY